MRCAPEGAINQIDGANSSRRFWASLDPTITKAETNQALEAEKSDLSALRNDKL